MFWFTQEPSSGSYHQCLAKTLAKHWLWFRDDGSCVSHSQRSAKITSLVQLCMSIQTLYLCIDMHISTRFVILAKHWLCIHDDGSCVKWNMLERLL